MTQQRKSSMSNSVCFKPKQPLLWSIYTHLRLNFVVDCLTGGGVFAFLVSFASEKTKQPQLKTRKKTKIKFNNKKILPRLTTIALNWFPSKRRSSAPVRPQCLDTSKWLPPRRSCIGCSRWLPIIDVTRDFAGWFQFNQIILVPERFQTANFSQLVMTTMITQVTVYIDECTFLPFLRTVDQLSDRRPQRFPDMGSSFAICATNHIRRLVISGKS